MFCPKCGTSNPNDGKFCRSCGTDLATVTAALTGELTPSYVPATQYVKDEVRRRMDPNEVYADGVKGVITGIGFFVVSMALLITNVAGGQAWWWAMLFPAFFGFAKGTSDLLKSRRMSPPNANPSVPIASSLNPARSSPTLPPPATDFIAPDSRYRTGDLVPPSVTDNTTRHLEVNNEGETMALPKK